MNAITESPPGLLAMVQGIYYLITGIWPLLHLPSFEKVSGPKTDKWLVRTVGVLITAIGAVLCLAAARRKPLAEPEIPTLAVGSAAGLTAIDVIYVAKGRISPIYLLDALLEIVLMAAWAFVLAPAEGQWKATGDTSFLVRGRRGVGMRRENDEQA